MDQLLNVIWLVVQIVGQCGLYYIHRQRALHGQRTSYLRCAVLLGCLIVLLFPAISMSDDLCWAQQINLDFDAAGVTQTTRANSRYDLPSQVLQTSTISLLDTASMRDGCIARSFARKTYSAQLPTSFYLPVPILRGPPSVGPLT